MWEGSDAKVAPRVSCGGYLYVAKEETHDVGGPSSKGGGGLLAEFFEREGGSFRAPCFDYMVNTS